MSYHGFTLFMDRSPGFGSTAYNSRPIQTRFPFGSDAPHLNLAICCNSPVRSTKSNRSHIYVLPTSVSAWFQVLFHSPPGVLFTFPSRYYPLSVTKEYLALGGGPPCFPPDFSCPAVLRIPAWLSNLSPTGLLPSSVPLSNGVRLNSPAIMLVHYPAGISTRGLGCFPFARHYSGNRCSFSSFGYLDVSVHRVPSSLPMCSAVGHTLLRVRGFPIRTSTDRRLFASPRGFSQLATSFFGSWYQGIPHAPSFA